MGANGSDVEMFQQQDTRMKETPNRVRKNLEKVVSKRESDNGKA